MDQVIFDFASNLGTKSSVDVFILRFLGVYLIYLIPVFLVWYWFLGSSKLALRAFLAGLLAWLGLAHLIGHLWFRARPFVALPGREFIFHRPTYSFPSDHAAFLSALALSFWLAGEKKTGLFLLFLALVIPAARVLSGLHWASDILGGWAVGVLAALMVWVFKAGLDKYLIDPLVRFLRKVKLG